MLFKKNIDRSGQILRAAIGACLLLYAWWASSWIALLFALFTFFESYASWCIFYQLIGKNTCLIKKSKSKE